MTFFEAIMCWLFLAAVVIQSLPSMMEAFARCLEIGHDLADKYRKEQEQ